MLFMKRKTKIIIIVFLVLAVVFVLAVLFVPTYGMYKDGGTKEYTAVIYKVVKWRHFYSYVDENGEVGYGTYIKEVVYWFPDSRKSLDELWEIEKQNIDKPKVY